MKSPDQLERGGFRTVILTRQIGHYHDARFRSAAARLGNLTVISTANEGEFAAFLASEIGEYRVIPLYRSLGEYRVAQSSGRLAVDVSQVLRAVDPDCIAVSGWANPESFEAILWARDNGVPVVVMSDSQSADAKRAWLRELIKAKVVRMCDAALVAGPTHREYVARLGLPMDKVHLGYDAVDNEYFLSKSAEARASSPALRKRLGLPDSYILASARFIRKKNLIALIEAYGCMLQKNVSAPDLVILGDGPLKDKVEEAITLHSSTNRVHLHGFRTYSELPVYYGLSEAFVHVSLVEQWGLVVSEAMASGVPVIVSSPCGVARAVINHGENGLVVDPSSIVDICAALEKIILMTSKERMSMGRLGQLAIGEWGPARFASGLHAAILDARQAVAQRRSAILDRSLLKALSKLVIRAVE
jgi:glycosyltransferase involved in cell wall biosynthesis